jgi:DNA-binding NtrC family response regulator
VVGRFGRPALNIPVNNIVDALRRHKSVTPAAEELGCSRGHIYNQLKVHGLTVREVINGSKILH